MPKLEFYDGTDWVTAGDGTVTLIETGTGLTGGPITTSGTVSLTDTGVTPGVYTYATITVDGQGRLTDAANGTQPVVTIDGTANEVVSTNTDPANGLYTISLDTELNFPGDVVVNNGSLTVPVGTTAERPATPVIGMFRLNTSL